MRTPFRSITILILLAALLFPVAAAGQSQVNQQYQVGNHLLRQQNYEQAYQIFERLHRNNPGNYLFLDKAAECLINLTRYDDAVALIRKATDQTDFAGQASVRLGEVYHIRGDTAQAFQIWEDTIDRHSQSFQTYLRVARTMSNRRAFNQSIAIYERAEARFSRSTLISTELANTYMQAGRYEESVLEFLELVREEPDRIDYVQRSLIRYGDEYLHDTAILEIEDFLDDLDRDHPSHRRLHQLHLWLLLERNLFERAVATARNYEENSEQVTFTLFGLGNRLRSEQEFELAEQAYRYYIEKDIIQAKYRSMEELAQVFRSWADYLEDYNLAYADRRDSLYQQAYSTLGRLQREDPYYDRMAGVLIAKAELAIDYLHRSDLAKQHLEELRNSPIPEQVPQQLYVEGRIHLADGDYDRARIAFTKSNRQENIGELAEKTRYYLSLTDFFSGDYEFAKIQLSALERQNTSYFANDAVQLRIWIQKGLAADTSGSILNPFANAIEHFTHGDQAEALEALKPIISGQAFHPLMDEALLELSRHITPGLMTITYAAITDYLERWGQTSPLRERLMWEKARIADQVITNDLQFPAAEIDEEPAGAQWAPTAVALPGTTAELQTLYEHILLEFPNGFYASYARERIQELQSPQT